MDLSPPCEASSFLDTQEIPRHLWNLKVHFLILSKMNPVHTLLSSFFNIYFNIIFPSMPRSSLWSLSFRFLHQNFICTYLLSSPMHATCRVHRILLDFMFRTISGE
jgi:hypothetical protein